MGRKCGTKSQEKALAKVLAKKNIDVTDLAPIIEAYRGTEGSLITVLQKAQALYGWLPLSLLHYIAAAMNLPPAKVYGVATFYAQFRLEPVGKYVILLCQGTACHVNGSAAIEEAIADELSINPGQTTEDGLFTLQSVACLGCCSLSPVMMIGEETYGSLTPAKARDILRGIQDKEQGELK